MEAMEYSNSRILYLINEYIHKDRDREILTLRLTKAHTYERIAEEISQNPEYTPITVRQVYRIVARESAKLYEYLKSPPEPLKE